MYCPSCLAKLDEVFKQVKEYIYDNPGVGVQEIAEKFELSVAIIHRWIREERLAFSESSDVGIECENCKRTIKTGRYCKTCKDQLMNTLGSAYGRSEEVHVEKAKSSSKMRFLN